MRFSVRNGTSCSGKTIYDTIGECERAMRKMLQKFRPHKHRVQPYRCGPCNGWHLTGMITREERHRIEIRDRNDQKYENPQTRAPSSPPGRRHAKAVLSMDHIGDAEDSAAGFGVPLSKWRIP